MVFFLGLVTSGLARCDNAGTLRQYASGSGQRDVQKVDVPRDLARARGLRTPAKSQEFRITVSLVEDFHPRPSWTEARP